MNAADLHAKLRQPAAVSRLADLCLDSLDSVPLTSLVTESEAQTLARKALEGWLASDVGTQYLTRAVEWLINETRADRRTIKDVAPKDLRYALRDLVARPFSPDRAVVLTVIDRDPTRELVRQLLLDAILEFGRKVSSPVAGVAKGLGGLARLAGETLKSQSSGIGGLFGAVSGEVERQLEKRAVEFVDSALGGIFGQVADLISDPKRASEAAELRIAFFDGVTELTLAQLSRELMNGDVSGGVEVFRAGMRRWLASADSDEAMARAIKLSRDAVGAKTMKDFLSAEQHLELRKVGHALLVARIEAVMGGPLFTTWLTDVLAAD